MPASCSAANKLKSIKSFVQAAYQCNARYKRREVPTQCFCVTTLIVTGRRCSDIVTVELNGSSPTTKDVRCRREL